jgi:transposase InsO family protein
MSTLCVMNNKNEMLCVLEEFKIPKEQHKIIGKVHNTYAGHHGVERTLAKLKAAGRSWTYMREHVKRFIRECPCCQKMSYIKVPIHTSPFTTATLEPNERINIDSIGPLPPDENENCHILNISDTFSRFIEMYAIKTTSAKEAAVCLLNYLGRYGCPCQVLSDNGSQFVNETISELFKLIGTEHVLTMAYSKEENAIVERANKELMRHLRAIIYHKM